jgi:hypothetical protein
MGCVGTALPVRRHSTPRRHRRWVTSYQPGPGKPTRERTAATREQAEEFARGLPAAAVAVEVLYVDGGGWSTPYPIRPAEPTSPATEER